MFKKFCISSSISITLIVFISSFSISTKSEYIYPIKHNNNISSYFGTRILYNKPNFHNGIDIPAVPGTGIYSLQSGIISYIGFDKNGYGNYIIIIHDNSYRSLYGHLSENMIVSIGDRIEAEHLIAYVGPKILSNGLSNGNTTGPHLHFTVYNSNNKTINPLDLEYKK